MMPSIDISVVIPAYNSGSTIKRCLKSIQAQTLSPYEIIVIDDGSVDNTIDAALSLNIKFLKVIRQRNMGVSYARNEGIKNSSAQFIAFLDSDDEWLPNHLEIMSSLVERHPDANIWSTGFIHKRGETEQIFCRPKHLHEKLNFEDYLCSLINNDDLVWTSATLVRKQSISSLGAFSERHNHGEDHEAWLKMIANDDTLVVSDQVTAIYHQETKGLSGALVTDDDAVMCSINQLLCRTSIVSAKKKSLLKKVFNRFSRAHALNCIHHSERRLARKFILKMYSSSIIDSEKIFLYVLTLLPLFTYKIIISLKNITR